VSVKEASDKLPDLVENTIEKREPVLISGKKKMPFSWLKVIGRQ